MPRAPRQGLGAHRALSAIDGIHDTGYPAPRPEAVPLTDDRQAATRGIDALTGMCRTRSGGIWRNADCAQPHTTGIRASVVTLNGSSRRPRGARPGRLPAASPPSGRTHWAVAPAGRLPTAP